MTRALLDHARVRARRREHPVGPEELQWDELPQTLDREPAQVVALLEALADLRAEQPQWVAAIEHRYYGGLTLEGTARMMDVDERTVPRWGGRAPWLLHPGSAPGGGRDGGRLPGAATHRPEHAARGRKADPSRAAADGAGGGAGPVSGRDGHAGEIGA